MLAASGDCKESQPCTSPSAECSRPFRFNFHEILLATDNFDESLIIGHGGFGKVYRGNIISRSRVVDVAIKRLDPMSSQGEAEFWAEVEMLSKLSHLHLVSLFGYCHNKKEFILIYEHMPNGTLADHLHKLGTPLSWIQRLNICIGAGRGLQYLHTATATGIKVGVIHRDVKTSNILLNKIWEAKISDVGLSKLVPTNQPSTYVNTLVKGTFGYLDPDYFFTGRLTRKSDVYAFGVVLLEVLCRKLAVDESLDEVQWNLGRWAQESIKEGNLKHIIDSGIRGQISPKCLKKFVQIAERCLHNNPKQRPTMAEVVVSLESALTLQEKRNSSLQPADKTIFGRMVDKFTLPSNSVDNSAHGYSKSLSNSKVNSRNAAGDTAGADNEECITSISSLRAFKNDDLLIATTNIGGDLRDDDFGWTSLGWFDKDTFSPSTEGGGITVAIRRYFGADPDWKARATGLARLAHPNISCLLGYCDDEEEIRLVRKHTKSPNFAQFLFGDVSKPLSWGKRLIIMIGVARGLAYIHSSPYEDVHGDVNTSNIFLDEYFNAKLGDFGMRTFGPEGGIPVTTAISCTRPYLDPEYGMTCDWRLKCDIYSFGVVLLETLTGKPATRHHNESGMVNWARQFLVNRSELMKIMDPRLEQNYSIEHAFKCAALASRCVAKNRRPSIEAVLRSLEEIYASCNGY